MSNKEIPEEKKGVHLSHCNQGEYLGSCKYGYEVCPALNFNSEDPPLHIIEFWKERIEKSFQVKCEIKEDISDYQQNGRWPYTYAYDFLRSMSPALLDPPSRSDFSNWTKIIAKEIGLSHKVLVEQLAYRYVVKFGYMS